jgi:hypothetical protein
VLESSIRDKKERETDQDGMPPPPIVLERSRILVSLLENCSIGSFVLPIDIYRRTHLVFSKLSILSDPSIHQSQTHLSPERDRFLIQTLLLRIPDIRRDDLVETQTVRLALGDLLLIHVRLGCEFSSDGVLDVLDVLMDRVE